MVSHPDWESVAFVRMDEFERLIQQSSLLIMHAGAGSVIHALRTQRLPIVMPRRAAKGEHIDDHQLEFATALASTGEVLLACNTAELRSAVRVALASPGRRATAPTQLVQHIRDLLARLEAHAMRKKAG
jgi:UDP-N-acetylglucosamine transferase subunit ALG13